MIFTFRKVGDVNLNCMQFYSVSVEGYNDFLIQLAAGDFGIEVLLRRMCVHCVNMNAAQNDQSEDFGNMIIKIFLYRTKIKGILQ